MKLPGILNTPLAATAGVVIGMALLAIPLRQLTSQETPPKRTMAAAQAGAPTPCWITLKLLAAANSVALKQADGTLVWSTRDLAAGETEVRKPLPLRQTPSGLILEIEFTDPSVETAAFLTIAPDGFGELTRYAIGSGSIRELLEFHWPKP